MLQQIHWASGKSACPNFLSSPNHPHHRSDSNMSARYWGCTKPLTGIPGQSLETITTASVMVTGSRSWKAYLENPWDATLCPTTSSAYSGSNSSVRARASGGQVFARGHTLVIPKTASRNDDYPVTTVVSGDVTL